MNRPRAEMEIAQSLEDPRKRQYSSDAGTGVAVVFAENRADMAEVGF